MTTHEANLALLVHDLEARGYIAAFDGTHGFAFTDDSGYEDEHGATVAGSIAWAAKYAIVTVDYNSPHVEPERKVIPFTHMDTLAAALDALYQEQ